MNIIQNLLVFIIVINCVLILFNHGIEYFIHDPLLFETSNITNIEQNEMFFLKSNQNNRISLLQINPQMPMLSNKYLVYSHGNKATILSNYHYFKNISEKLGVNIIIYDYIGYGLSENIMPSEQRCYESLGTVMDYLINNKNIDPTNIYHIGRSLGTGVVVDYISKNNWITPILLIAPYKSIISVKIESNIFSFVDKFNTFSKLKNVACPIKIFHGDADDVINISHGMEIYRTLLNKSLEPVWLKGIGHRDIIDVIGIDEYVDLINHNETNIIKKIEK